jgi:TatD DNase family protein
VFHCFTGDAGMARRALDIGFYVSFAGIVTFPKADSLREAARMVPTTGCWSKPTAPTWRRCPSRQAERAGLRRAVVESLARTARRPAATSRTDQLTISSPFRSVLSLIL